MNVANNHAMDYGRRRRARRSPRCARRAPRLRRAAGADRGREGGRLKVAFIGAAPYPWAQSLLDIPGTAALVRKAANEADVVIVYMHAGAEGSSADHVPTGPETFLGEQRGDPRAFAHAMIDAGARSCSGPARTRCAGWSGTTAI